MGGKIFSVRFDHQPDLIRMGVISNPLNQWRVDGDRLFGGKRALEVLEEQLKAGKRRIGIFYGAGHLPGMERRLIADFGLKRSNVHWIEAWNLRP